MIPELYIIATPEDLPDNEFEKLLNLLPQDRIDRIVKFRFRKSALHSLAGEMIVRTRLSELLSVTPDNLEIIRDSFGKPSLNNCQHLHFNVAHSGRFVAAAFDSTTIGVDIEYMRPIDLAIAERFFCMQEYETLKNLPEQFQRDYFYRLWTLKESYIKAEGKGLSLSLGSFGFTLCENGDIDFERFSGEQSHQYLFRHYPVAPDYKCALCVSSGFFPDQPIDISFEDLCDMFVAKNNRRS